MSYTIYYDKRVFKVGEDLYVAMINSGDNNCWECRYPRDIPSKNWSPIRLKGKYILSKEEILSAIKGSEKWEVAKARNNYFKGDEFEKWLMAGVKNAITLEDAVSYSKFNRFRIYDCSKESVFDNTEYVETTDRLVEVLNEISKSSNNIRVSLDCRDFTPKKKSNTNREKVAQDHYYVINISSIKNNTGGYFVRKTKWGYKYTPFNGISSVRKFKTEKLANKYAEILKESILGCECTVEKINKVAYF